MPRLPAAGQPVTLTPPSRLSWTTDRRTLPFLRGNSPSFDNLGVVLADHINPDPTKSLYHFLSESHGLACSLLPSPYQKRKRSDTINTLLHQKQDTSEKNGDTAITAHKKHAKHPIPSIMCVYVHVYTHTYLSYTQTHILVIASQNVKE